MFQTCGEHLMYGVTGSAAAFRLRRLYFVAENILAGGAAAVTSLYIARTLNTWAVLACNKK